MTLVNVDLDFDFKEKIIAEIMEYTDYDNVEINLDEFELEVDYEIKVNVKSIKLDKKFK